MENGIIRESSSPFAFPIVLVSKANTNEKRLCIDYRRLNAKTKDAFFPLPNFDDINSFVGHHKAQLFTVLDLKSGYWQVHMEEGSTQYTAFMTGSSGDTQNQLYEFVRMPFGLKGAPATFARAMSKCLRGLPYIQAYLDDILIVSARDMISHSLRLQEVFDRLAKHNVYLNPKKCKWAMEKICYLGFEYSNESVTIDQSKIKAITSYPVPKTQKQLRAYLGFINYFRRFVKNYSKRTANLRDLLRKDKEFKWESCHQNEFDDMKQCLLSKPILRYPDNSKKFYVTTDGSRTGIGYILTQFDDNNREYIIACGGRGLTKAESNYSVTELELLSLVTAIREYHVYLASKKFTILTDHEALKYLQNMKNFTTGRLGRWSLLLSEYEFEVIYKKGSLNTAADALSRREYDDTAVTPSVDDLEGSSFITSIDVVEELDQNSQPKVKVNTSVEWEEIEILPDEKKGEINALDSVEETPPVEIQFTPPDLRKMQSECIDCQEMMNYLKTGELPADETAARRIVMESENFVIDSGDDLLKHIYTPRAKNMANIMGAIKQIVIPQPLREELLKGYHDGWGHMAFGKMYPAIRTRYYWKGMTADIELWVKTCEVCQLCKKDANVTKAPPHSLQIGDIFERVHLDHMELRKSGNYSYVLVICDATSQYSELIPTVSTGAEETVSLFLNNWVARYGCPKSILTDRAKCYTGQLMCALTDLLGAKRLRTSSRHPQTNSVAENLNSRILSILRRYDTSQTAWPSLLPTVAMYLRSMPLTSIHLSPYQIVFGRPFRTMFDAQVIGENNKNITVQNFFDQHKRQIDLIEQVAKENLYQAHQISREKAAKEVRREEDFRIGDKVLMRNWRVKPGQKKKQNPLFEGPYLIENVLANHTLKLRHCDSGRLMTSPVNFKEVKRFFEGRDKFYNRDRNTRLKEVSDAPLDAPTTQETLPDGWYTIDKVLNRQNRKGKVFFQVLWSDGTTSWCPAHDVNSAAKESWYTEQALKKQNKRPRKR